MIDFTKETRQLNVQLNMLDKNYIPLSGCGAFGMVPFYNSTSQCNVAVDNMLKGDSQ